MVFVLKKLLPLAESNGFCSRSMKIAILRNCFVRPTLKMGFRTNFHQPYPQKAIWPRFWRYRTITTQNTYFATCWIEWFGSRSLYIAILRYIVTCVSSPHSYGFSGLVFTSRTKKSHLASFLELWNYHHLKYTCCGMLNWMILVPEAWKSLSCEISEFFCSAHTQNGFPDPFSLIIPQKSLWPLFKSYSVCGFVLIQNHKDLLPDGIQYTVYTTLPFAFTLLYDFIAGVFKEKTIPRNWSWAFILLVKHSTAIYHPTDLRPIDCNYIVI
jgi:hypothetical protein